MWNWNPSPLHSTARQAEHNARRRLVVLRQPVEFSLELADDAPQPLDGERAHRTGEQPRST